MYTEKYKNKSLQELEVLYVSYKTAYYTGKTLVTDKEFDFLENRLKSLDSNIVKLVGYKFNDFEYKHPSRMRSLSKIQMDEFSNKFDDVVKWYEDRCKILGEYPNIVSSPKFDGNAINIIVENDKVVNALTRGDGTYGLSVHNKLNKQCEYVRKLSKNYTDEETYEIRCECVIDKYLFQEKYADEKANARNYVAGILRQDNPSEIECSELTLVPLQIIVEGHAGEDINIDGEFIIHNIKDNENYNRAINYFNDLRIRYKYLLDGIVLTFPAQYRSILGENDHDPEWSTAIKFIPDTAETYNNSISWQIGRTGEFTPVLNITPIELAGTIVKRVTGYNAGYILKNKIGIGAKIEVHKSGEIIPEIKKVLTEAEPVLPTFCPYCNNATKLDDIHLMCTNLLCSGRISKKLADMSKILNIKGIGPAISELFNNECNNSLELLIFLKKNMSENKVIFEKFGFDITSKSFYNFENAINSFNELDSYKIFQLYNYEGLGETLSKELSKEIDSNDGNFFGHEKKIVEMFTSKKYVYEYLDNIKTLENLGIKVKKYEKPSDDIIWVEMTGSPKSHGFKSKSEWLAQFNGKVMTCGLSDNKCMYLITDDLNASSSKMKSATKKGIKIITYSDKL